jgi:hypothetical protein
MEGTKDIAIRWNNAEKRFVEFTMETINCTEDDGYKILFVYKKHKVIKIDAIVGQFNLKHGVFAEAKVLQNALAQS